jgi:hypothetical protein
VKTIIVLFVTFILNLAQAHILLKDGGISGGGGNVISPTAPQRLQDPYSIRVDVLASRKILKEFIKAKHDLYIFNNMNADDKRIYSILFEDNSHGILESMNDVPLFIPVYEPCYDLSGNPFDGAAVNAESHAVCISAFNLALKVDRSNVTIQAAALILHELAHVAGLNDEEDAIYLQNQLIKEYKFKLIKIEKE